MTFHLVEGGKKFKAQSNVSLFFPQPESVPLSDEMISRDRFELVNHQEWDDSEVLEAILDHMDPEGRIKSDRESFILKHIVAPLTPVLGVSDQCFNQSITYMKRLLHFDLWAVLSKILLLFILIYHQIVWFPEHFT